jgi:hypothetical protein
MARHKLLTREQLRRLFEFWGDELSPEQALRVLFYLEWLPFQITILRGDEYVERGGRGGSSLLGVEFGHPWRRKPLA